MGAADPEVAVTDAIPEFHIWPQEFRPSIKHDVYHADLPVVDLAPVFQLEELIAKGEASAGVSAVHLLQAQRQAILQQVKAGCEEYGFFQVVNHGFPMQVVEQLSSAAQPFFQQPSEVKETVAIPQGSVFGYNSMAAKGAYIANVLHNPATSWQEALAVPSHHQGTTLNGSAEALSRTGFGGGLTQQQIRALFEEYGKHAERLVLKLLELLAESLGLPDDYFTREFTSRSSMGEWPRYYTRLNYYPKCPRPDLALGAPGHIDPGVLTLLHQDAVGGLQILTKDGQQWLGVRPIPGAFVINAGDLLQMWSNDRYISAEHRVVTNDKSARLSIAHFFAPHDDTDVVISPQLVDSDHPHRYRTSKSHELFQHMRSVGVKGRGHLTRHFQL